MIYLLCAYVYNICTQSGDYTTVMLKNIPYLYIANNALYDCNIGLMFLFIIVASFLLCEI